MRNSQSIPPQQAQVQAAQQAQVAAWQAAQAQAQEQAAAQQAAQAQAAQQQAAAQAQAVAQAQQQAAEYAQAQAAWQAQQEQMMAQQAYYAAPTASSGRAIAALVCGILALLHFYLPVVGLILAIVAIVLALSSNKQFGKTGTSKGGLICGIIGGVLSLAATVATGFLIFTLVQGINAGTMGFNVDAIFRPSGAMSQSGSFDYADYLNTNEQSAYDALSTKLTAIANGDAAAMQEIGTLADQSFQKAYGTSMASCDIDPLSYARVMTENFTYDIDTVVVTEGQSEGNYVSATLSCRDVSDVKEKFNEALTELDAGTDLSSVTSTEVAAQIGEAFNTAANNAYFAANKQIRVNLIQTGETWSVDQASYIEQLNTLFGLA